MRLPCDDDAGSLDYGIGFLTFLELQAGDGFGSDARNDFDAGRDFQGDGTADGAFFEDGDFAWDDTASADFLNRV